MGPLSNRKEFRHFAVRMSKIGAVLGKSPPLPACSPSDRLCTHTRARARTHTRGLTGRAISRDKNAMGH